MKQSANLNTFLILLIVLMCMIPQIIPAQEVDNYLPFADKMPEPVGGIEAIYKKVIYPEAARRAGLEGKVYVQIYVDENGSVNDVKILKDIGMGCGNAAAEAIKKIKYKPGQNKSLTVKIKMAMAINFQLK